MEPFLSEKNEDLIIFHRFILAFIIMIYLVVNSRNWLMHNNLFFKKAFHPEGFLA